MATSDDTYWPWDGPARPEPYHEIRLDPVRFAAEQRLSRIYLQQAEMQMHVDHVAQELVIRMEAMVLGKDLAPTITTNKRKETKEGRTVESRRAFPRTHWDVLKRPIWQWLVGIDDYLRINEVTRDPWFVESPAYIRTILWLGRLFEPKFEVVEVVRREVAKIEVHETHRHETRVCPHIDMTFSDHRAVHLRWLQEGG